MTNEADDPRTVWEMREGDAVPIGENILVTVVRVGRRPAIAIDAPGNVQVGPLRRRQVRRPESEEGGS